MFTLLHCLSILWKLCRGDATFWLWMSWDLDYEKRFAELQLLGLPRRTAHRNEGQPIVLSRGPVSAANAERFPTSFDLRLFGDDEGTLRALGISNSIIR